MLFRSDTYNLQMAELNGDEATFYLLPFVVNSGVYEGMIGVCLDSDYETWHTFSLPLPENNEFLAGYSYEYSLYMGGNTRGNHVTLDRICKRNP